MNKAAKEHARIVPSGLMKLTYTVAGIIALSLLVLYGVSVNDNVWDYVHEIKAKNTSLIVENSDLRADLDRYVSHSFTVDLTIYHNKREQTDSTPLITADGTTIPKAEVYHVGTRRLCAVSRDLHKRFGGSIDYGDYIYIGKHIEKIKYVKDPENPTKTIKMSVLVEGPFTGFWRVSDIMGKEVHWTDAGGIARTRKITNTIDLLMDINHKNAKFVGVKATLFPNDVFLVNTQDAESGV